LKPMKSVLVGLLLAAPLLAAEDQADPVTALLPARARLIVRLPSLDRMDAIAAEMQPVLALFGDQVPFGKPGQAAVSDQVLARLGIDAGAGVDRSKAIYVGVVAKEPFYVFSGSARTVWEGQTPLVGGFVGIVKDGAILASKPALLTEAPRGTPVSLIAGDVVAHVALGELIAENRGEIDKSLAEWKTELATLTVPDAARGLLGELLDLAGPGLDGLDAIQYAISVRDGGLYSDGLIRLKEGSGFRKLMRQGGAPGDCDLVSLMPRRAFISGDGMTNAQWGMESIRSMLDRHLGEGTSDALVGLLGPAALCNEQLTGRSAFSMSLDTMMPSTLTIYELKDAAKAEELIRGMDVDRINAALEKLEVPVRVAFELDASVYGETRLHRLSTSTDMQGIQMPMFSNQQSYVAIVGDKLLVSSGLTAESDMKSLIDRVRSGDVTREHPHLVAMHRLCEKRSFGFTINFGAIKPMFGMVAMFEPDAGPLLQAVPDEMPMSTAFVIDDGNLRWHGDWPVDGVLAIARKAMEIERGRKIEREATPKSDEPDFD